MALDWHVIAKEKGYDTPESFLKKLYLDEKFTMQDIATLVGCSSWAVGRAIDKFNIGRHAHGGVRRFKGKPSISAIESVLQRLAKETK